MSKNNTAVLCVFIFIVALVVILLLLNNNDGCGCKRREGYGHCVCSNKRGVPTVCPGTATCDYGSKGVSEYSDFNITMKPAMGWLTDLV